MEDKNAVDFAKRLKFFMLQNNISSKELAGRLNVSKQTVTNWNKGNNTPNAPKCLEIIRHYNVDAKWLFFGKVTELRNMEEEAVLYGDNKERFYKEILRGKNEMIELLKSSLHDKNTQVQELQEIIKKMEAGTTSGTTAK